MGDWTLEGLETRGAWRLGGGEREGEGVVVREAGKTEFKPEEVKT